MKVTTCRSLRASHRKSVKKSIGQLNEEARAAGMSYGQYVASLQPRIRKE